MTGRSLTNVHLVRHGAVENPQGILYGRLPGFGLSAAGRRMVEQTAALLADEDVAFAATSPLDRAVQTAELLLAGRDLPLRRDDRLVESANVFQGVHPGRWLVWRPTTWWYVRNPFAPSWGERYRQVAERMLAALADARRAAAGRAAVLVSHQQPIWVLRLAVEGRPLWHRPDRRLCGLGSLTTLCYRDDRLVTVTYREPVADAAPPPRPAAGRRRAPVPPAAPGSGTATGG